ncbi:tRNA-dependent cyclodipeptide synthase [Streptomyces nigrescens]
MSTPERDEPPAAVAVTLPSSRCAAAIDRAEHARFGISPFNRYFSAGRIRQLAAWGLGRFADVHFYMPAAPSAFAFEALGYGPERAAWKARRQGQYTRNRILAALRDLDVADAEDRVLGWAELDGNAEYSRLYGRAELAPRARTGLRSRRAPRFPARAPELNNDAQCRSGHATPTCPPVPRIETSPA